MSQPPRSLQERPVQPAQAHMGQHTHFVSKASHAEQLSAVCPQLGISSPPHQQQASSLPVGSQHSTCAVSSTLRQQLDSNGSLAQQQTSVVPGSSQRQSPFATDGKEPVLQQQPGAAFIRHTAQYERPEWQHAAHQAEFKAQEVAKYGEACSSSTELAFWESPVQRVAEHQKPACSQGNACYVAFTGTTDLQADLQARHCDTR